MLAECRQNDNHYQPLLSTEARLDIFKISKELREHLAARLWAKKPLLYCPVESRGYLPESTLPHLGLSKRIAVVPAPISWAHWVVENYHYLKRKVSPRARPLGYAILLDGEGVGTIICGLPHFTKQRGLFGYPPELPTQWQTLMVSRMWLHPEVQNLAVCDRNGRTHTFPVGSCAASKLLQRIQSDWLLHSPPPHPDLPYHIRLVMSYSDPAYGHYGTLYKAAGFEFWGWTTNNRPRHSGTRGKGDTSPKMIWIKRLAEPNWDHNVQQVLF